MNSRLILRNVSTMDRPPLYLAPAFAFTSPLPSRSQFSTTASACQRKGRRDGNPNRGVSELRRTGLRYPVGMSHVPLPKPVLDPRKRSKVKVDPDHGLWGFFNPDKTLLSKPDQLSAHGRGWTNKELRNKSWEDLHSLWWICCRERNKLATETYERRRLGLPGGDAEAGMRLEQVNVTMRSIKYILTERWYAWEDAYRMAEEDPQVNLDAEGSTPAYEPRVSEQEEADRANLAASRG